MPSITVEYDTWSAYIVPPFKYLDGRTVLKLGGTRKVSADQNQEEKMNRTKEVGKESGEKTKKREKAKENEKKAQGGGGVGEKGSETEKEKKEVGNVGKEKEVETPKEKEVKGVEVEEGALQQAQQLYDDGVFTKEEWEMEKVCGCVGVCTGCFVREGYYYENRMMTGHTLLHTRARTHTYTHTHTRTKRYLHTYIQRHTYIHTYMYTCMHAHIHTDTPYHTCIPT